MLYLFNTTIATTPGLTYHTSTITADEARRALLAAPEWTSAIGHEASATILSLVLDASVPINRIPAAMQAGDEAICLKLRGRIPEGAVLDREQVEVIGYDLVLMTAAAPQAEDERPRVSETVGGAAYETDDGTLYWQAPNGRVWRLHLNWMEASAAVLGDDAQPVYLVSTAVARALREVANSFAAGGRTRRDSADEQEARVARRLFGK